ncbi:MAG: AbrB/MazE/SpoVT family DNA-binding domain-containing protein [Actinomycetota bacterium]|jgi:AbrB family looped-hinge helix DNA binding protein|nr:AbrB/MazE/SpoVT family DNA-binding domain-containing protein [Actinomycetota bacterium]MDQ3353453.1 AbrB/MazE/SpoVT family DNA-binding domain-containing protein [Actinomycetota bacterium]
MRTTIDDAGRIVIPKSLREAVGLRGGRVVEVSVRDGRIEIEPTTLPMQVVEAPGGPVIQPESEVSPLSGEMVRATLEQARR